MTENINKYASMANEMRKDILKMALKAGSSGAHLGGAMSAADILSILYGSILNQDKKEWNLRDRLIMSKGHCVMAQYAAMKQCGLISQADLDAFENQDSWLCSHATRNLEVGLEFSTGSLGQGLSLGIGVALGLRKKHSKPPRVFVLMGDGECDEGQVWEAAMAGAHFKLNNLCAIVDANGMQVDGYCRDVLNHADLAEKWQTFGWEAREINGHDFKELKNAFIQPEQKPLAIIAHTVKGKGVSFMENSAAWHHGRLGKKQYEQALKEMEQVCHD